MNDLNQPIITQKSILPTYTLEDTLNFLKGHVNGRVFSGDFLADYPKILLPVVKIHLGGGVTHNLSIQASQFTYCTPRKNCEEYTHVEDGFPTFKFSDDFIEDYAEDKKRPMDTVYSYVPLEVLAEEIFNFVRACVKCNYKIIKGVL